MKLKKHRTYFLGKRVSEHQIVLRFGKGIDTIKCGDILYLEAERAYCNFYLTNGRKVNVGRSLSFFEAKLLEWNFIRAHKSYLINMQHIEKYIYGKNSAVVLTDKSEVPVAVRKRNSFVNRVKVSTKSENYIPAIAV